MRHYLIPSLILVAVCLSVLIPQASALPVSYNQTALNFGLTSVPRNSSSYDVFPLIPDNWLWEKFDNNTIDSGPLSIAGTVTYNTNLNALYKGENNLLDSTTHGFTLTKVAGTNNFASGQEGNAFSFDGLTYYTASSSSVITGSGDRSVTFWIKTPSTFTNNAFLWSWGSNSLNSEFSTTWLSTASTSKLEVYLGSGATIYSSTAVFNPNTWYHVGITLGSTGTVLKIYINGSLDSTQTIATQNTSSSSFNLGALVGGTNLIQSGSIIDEFRIYSSTISASQISALDMVGHYSQSHTFDGGEYVSLGNTLGFERTNPFSITLWEKSTNTNSENLIGKWLANAPYTGYLLQTIGSGEFRFYLINTYPTNLISAHVLSSSLLDGNWHYIGVTYDGSSSISGVKIYIDGISTSFSNEFNSLSGTILSGTQPFVIGTDTSINSPFIGQEDNVKVYPYALSSSQITSDYNSISPISSGKQFMSWYNGIQGSSILTEKLGTTKSSLSLGCTLSSTIVNNIVSNNTKLYYTCSDVRQIDITSGQDSHYFTPTGDCGACTQTQDALFSTMQNIIFLGANNGGQVNHLSTKTLNATLSTATASWQVSDQKVNTGTSGIKYNMNTTALQTVTTNPCEINYKPTNTTKVIDSISCDKSLPAPMTKYWNGFNIQGISNYSTNSTQQFLNSIDASPYKKLLSLPCNLLVSDAPPCVTFILTDQTQTDYFIVLTSTHVYYQKAQTALNYLTKNNYALQSYDIVAPLTTSAFEIQNPILQGISLYGFNLNTTTNKAGLMTLPSGYTTKTTTINSAIRTIDPRWTNDLTDIPIITTTQSLFPIFLTASNAPAFAAIKVTQGTQILNGQEAVYAVAQLDSTRSVEFDLIAGTCANIYIADISVSPSIWNFQGIICATGVNQKTIAYTNTVPFTFFTLKYGVTDSFTPSNNALTTTFRTNIAPTTYTVIVKNATGIVAINQTFTIPANQTTDTRSFNVSSVSKPASLMVTVAGNQVYSAYLGSSLSLASVAAFFHQNFSYQGFDLLSFIPIIFAASFTRNTVGVGGVLVVLMIATLSWLSVTVVPEPVVYVSIILSIIAMVGYRSIYG